MLISHTDLMQRLKKHFLWCLAVLLLFSLSGCQSGKVRVVVDSEGADNSGYTALLTRVKGGVPTVDTLTFVEPEQEFTFLFDIDSIDGAYLSIGNFQQYLPIPIGDRSKIRCHLEIASPHLCYDRDVAEETGFDRFAKDNAELFRSFDKASGEKDQEHAIKDAKILAQQFIDYASSLSSRQKKRLRHQMDWGVEVVSLYAQGKALLRQSLLDDSIDSALFSPEIYRMIVGQEATTPPSSPALYAIAKGDTILWTPTAYPRGRIFVDCANDWQRVNYPSASKDRINLILPLAAIDSIGKQAKTLPPHTYIVDGSEAHQLQLYHLLTSEQRSKIFHYHTAPGGRIIIDSTTLISHKPASQSNVGQDVFLHLDELRRSISIR